VRQVRVVPRRPVPHCENTNWRTNPTPSATATPRPRRRRICGAASRNTSICRGIR
jgi:hypothetical protein